MTIFQLQAVLAFYYETFALLIIAFYTFMAIWFGACFYMDTFAKQYEQRLAALQEMTQTVGQSST